ncbi:POTRA domain-containing protein [Lutimonas sp.]|uniref:POTRA domain-containing protein n=1 Tax=Lutimonas sp. TaxID=1872403 RepID=UPI003C76216F
MKLNFTPYIYILIFLIGFQVIQAQDQTLQIVLNSEEKQDLLSLEKSPKKIAEKDAIDHEINSFVQKIELMGYLGSRLDSLVHRDSLWIAYIDPGSRVESIYIDYHQVPQAILTQKELKRYSNELTDTKILIPFSELSDFMQSLVDLFEKKGNSFVQFSLEQIELINNQASAVLVMNLNRQRRIDKVVIKGYENFPKNYLDHELDLKIGSVFNKQKIESASRSVNNLTFAEEIKPPEILFTNDSTIVYLYLKKKKSNQFDGIIGFASKENDDGLEFNGYLDLAINNIFNSGETIALFWKNNGNNRQRFYIETEIPYLFNLPLTPKLNFELYRQDSTFSNTRAHVSLLYNMIGKGQIAAQLNAENSNDLSNGTSSGISSYSNLFYGISYIFKKLSSDPLFPVTFNIDIGALAGTRKNEGQSTSQSKFHLSTHYLYAINTKNYVFVQNSSGILNSDDYFENELFRIGGIYNLRGVNEESIFASAFTVFNLEYRFKPNISSYFYTITDFSYAENNLTQTNTNVVSFGLGYAFQTKAGILNLSYALGKFDKEPVSFDNSKIHIKIVSKF